MKLTEITKNKVFNYVFSRYAIYGIQFLNTLMLAKLLSPVNFGIWGFTQLIINYFNHIDFGVPSSFNTLAAIHKKNKKYVYFNFNASLTLTSLLSVLVIVFFTIMYLIEYDFGSKYNFNAYLIPVLLIIVLSYFNKLFMNLFRIYNKLKAITFYQSIVQLVVLATFILFSNDLIYYLLLGMIFANVLALLVFIYDSPVVLKLNFSKRLLSQIQKSGIYLFIYNASFYFIVLSTRSVISYFYEVEEFGWFNFAFSLAAVIELILSAFMFLIFPKMINRLAQQSNEEAYTTINYLQSNYTLIISSMSYMAIALFPLFLYWLPEYTNSITAFNLILLTKLVYSNCYGSPVLLMAKKQERKLALVAFIVLLINILCSILFASVFNFSFDQAVLGTFVAYLVYVMWMNRMSLNLLGQNNSLLTVFNYSFPFKMLAPILIGVSFSIFELPLYLYVVLLLVFIALNFKSFFELKELIVKLVTKPDLVDI